MVNQIKQVTSLILVNVVMKITTGDKNNDRWSAETCEKLINPMRIVWHLQKKNWQKKRCFDKTNKTKRILESFVGFYLMFQVWELVLFIFAYSLCVILLAEWIWNSDFAILRFKIGQFLVVFLIYTSPWSLKIGA